MKSTLTQVMGIVNVTPDSFSDGGKWASASAAIAHAHELAAQGATILDIGGESTRPGATPLAPAEEWERIEPVVRALAGEGFTLSIDTYHSETAQRAVDAGAKIINDVTGGLADPRMFEVVGRLGVPYILQHMRGTPDTMSSLAEYNDVAAEVFAELEARCALAIQAGVSPSNIILDPGFGFAKNGVQNWQLAVACRQLNEDSPYAWMVGVSRKRFLAEFAEDAPGRDDATAALSMFFALEGAWAVRVHSVPASAAAVKVAQRLKEQSYVASADRTVGTEVGAVPQSNVILNKSTSPCAHAHNHSCAAMGSNTVHICGVRVRAAHGVRPAEYANPQDFFTDVSVELATPASNDDLATTISYSEVAGDIQAAFASGHRGLIETLAEDIATRVLDRGALRVAVHIHKPHAPVRAEFSDVGVSIVREHPILQAGVIRQVVLSLGSNIGDGVKTLRWAIKKIKKLPVAIRALSSFYTTEPLLAEGQAPQNPYTNAVLIVTTAMAPRELLAALQEIEVRAGRVRNERWGARTLDIDVIDVEGLRSAAPELILPHPRAHERRFVLEPWAEVDPQARLGGVGITELLHTAQGECFRINTQAE